jgi:hypothetical protein
VAPCLRGVVLCIAPSQTQAQVVLNYVAGVLEASAHVPFVLPRRWNFFLLVGRYAFDVSDEHGEARTHRCRSIRFVGRLQPSVYFETGRLRYGSASRRARFHETSMFRLTLIGLNHRPCVWFLCRGPRSRCLACLAKKLLLRAHGRSNPIRRGFPSRRPGRQISLRNAKLCAAGYEVGGAACLQS